MMPERRRIFLVNRYFYPDSSATSQMLSDLAFFLAERGWDVNIVTSAGAYSGPVSQLSRHENVRGVTVHRVGPLGVRPNSLAMRALASVRLHWAFALEIFRRTRAGDVLVIKTDPPLLSVSAATLVKFRKLVQINWLQDLYPEVAIELGVSGMGGVVGRGLTTLRNASLRNAAMNVAIGERMHDRIVGLGVPRARAAFIPNWCDDEAIQPQSPGLNFLRREWGLEGKFVVGYSGNLGRVHEIDTVLNAASMLQDEDGLVFLFIGGGYFTARLKQEVKARGLEAMFQFLPYQEARLLPQSLGVPDMHWLSLNPRMEGLVLPSKFYGIAAAGKAMIAVMDQDGEIAHLIRHAECGAVVSPGNAAAFADVVRSWRRHPELLAAKGRRAREMLDQSYRRLASLDRWQCMLNSTIRQVESTMAPGPLA